MCVSQRLVILAGLAGLAGGALAQTPDPQIPGLYNDPPAGVYETDPAHTSLAVRADHLGFSDYLVLFTDVEATLDFDPAEPERMSVQARIGTASLTTHYPLDDLDFDAVLTGPDWLQAGRFPDIRFVSDRVEPTGDTTADLHGTLSFLGVDQPVVLAVTYNGGWAGLDPHDPQARIGFSATTQLDRSAFGLTNGLPPAGTDFGVADQVDVRIEAEFTGPPLTLPAE